MYLCRIGRPYYLQDLVDEPFEDGDTLGLLVRETIGGEYYSGPDNYVVNMSVGEVQQWNLQGSEGHPFHMHVNHVQYVNVDGPSLVPGWNQVGDWVDTVSSECSRDSKLEKTKRVSNVRTRSKRNDAKQHHLD